MFGNWKLRIFVLIVITCLLVDVLAHHKRRRSQRRSSIRKKSNPKTDKGNRSRGNESVIPTKVRASKQAILQLREVLLERIRQGEKSNIGVFIIGGATKVVRGKSRIRALSKNNRLLTTTHVRRLVGVLEKRLQAYDRQQKPNETEKVGVIEKSSDGNAQQITITRSIAQSTTSIPSTESANFVNQPRFLPVTEITTLAQSKTQIPTSEFMFNQQTRMRSNVQSVSNIRPPATNNDNSGFMNPVFSARGAWSGRGRVNNMRRNNFNNVRNNQRQRTQTNSNSSFRSNISSRPSNGRFMNTGNFRMSPSWRHSSGRTVQQQQQQQMFQQQQQQQQQRTSRFSVNQQASQRNQPPNTWSRRNPPFSQNRQSFSNQGRNQMRRPMFPSGRMSSVSGASSPTRRTLPGINRNRSFQGRNQGSNGEFVLDSQVIEVDNRGAPRIVERNGMMLNNQRNRHTERNSQRTFQNSPRTMGTNRPGVRKSSSSNPSNLDSNFSRFRTVARHITEPFPDSVDKNRENTDINNRIIDRNEPAEAGVKDQSLPQSQSTENNRGTNDINKPNTRSISSDLNKLLPKDVKQDIPKDPQLADAIKTVEGYLATKNKSLTISKEASKQQLSSLVYPTLPGALSLPPITSTQRPLPLTSTQDSVSGLIKQLINKPRLQVTETDLKLIEEIKLLMKLNSNKGLVSDADMKLLNEIELLARGVKVPNGSGPTSKPPLPVKQPNPISPMMDNVGSGNSAPQTLQNGVNQQGTKDIDMLINAASGVINNKAPLNTNQQMLGELEKILQNPPNNPTSVNVQRASTGNANILSELDRLLNVNPSAVNVESLRSNAQLIRSQSGTIQTQAVVNGNQSGRTSQSEINILKELGKILQNNGQNTPVAQTQNSNLLSTNVAQQGLLHQNVHQMQSAGRGSMPPGVMPLGQTHSSQQSLTPFQQLGNQGLGANVQQQRLLMANPMMANPMAQLMGLGPILGPDAMMELMYGDTTDPPDPTQKPTVATLTTAKPVVATSTTPPTATRATTKRATTTVTTTTSPVSQTTPMLKIPIKTLMQKITGMVEQKTKQLRQKQEMAVAKKSQNTAKVSPSLKKPDVIHKKKVEQNVSSKQKDQNTVLSKIQESIRKALQEAGIKHNIQLVVKPKESSNSEIPNVQNMEKRSRHKVETKSKAFLESNKRPIPQQRRSQTARQSEHNRVTQPQKETRDQRTEYNVGATTAVQSDTSRNGKWKVMSDNHSLRDDKQWQIERKNLAFKDTRSQNPNVIKSPERNANPYDKQLQKKLSKLETTQTSHIVDENKNGAFSNPRTTVSRSENIAANRRFNNRESFSYISSNSNTQSNQNVKSNTLTSVTHSSAKKPVLIRDAQKRRQISKKNISSDVNEQIDKLKSVRDILSKSLPHSQYRNIVDTLESLIAPNAASAKAKENGNGNNKQINSKRTIQAREKVMENQRVPPINLKQTVVTNFNVKHSNDRISGQQGQRIENKHKEENGPLGGSNVNSNKQSFSIIRSNSDTRKQNNGFPPKPSTNLVSFTYKDPTSAKLNVKSGSSVQDKTISGTDPSLPPSKELEFLLGDKPSTFKFPGTQPSIGSVNTAQIDPGSLQDVRLSVSHLQHSDKNSNNAGNSEANEIQNLIGDLDSIVKGRLVSRATKNANKETDNNSFNQAALLGMKNSRSLVASAVLTKPGKHLTKSVGTNAGGASEAQRMSYNIQTNTQTGQTPSNLHLSSVDINQNKGVSSKGFVRYGQMNNPESLTLDQNKEISFRALESTRKSPDLTIVPSRMMSKETSVGGMLKEGELKYDVRNQVRNQISTFTNSDSSQVLSEKKNTGESKAVNVNIQTSLPIANLQNSTSLESALLKMVKKEVLKTVHELKTSNTLRPTTGRPTLPRKRVEFERIDIESRRHTDRKTTTTHSPKLIKLIRPIPRTTTSGPDIASYTTGIPRRDSPSTPSHYSNLVSVCDPKHQRYHCTGKDLFLGMTSIGAWCVGKCLKGGCVESVCNCTTTCERSGKVDMNEIIGNAIASAISGHSALDGKAESALQALLSSLEISNKELTVQIGSNVQTTLNPELPLAISKRSSSPPIITSTQGPQKSLSKSMSDINALLSSIESLIDAKIKGINPVTPSSLSTSTIQTTTDVPRDAEGEIIELEDRVPAKNVSTSTEPPTQPTLPQYYESSTNKQPAGIGRFFDNVGRNRIDKDPRFRPTDGPWRDRNGSFRNRRRNGDWRRDPRDRHWDRSWREPSPTAPATREPSDSAWSADRHWRDRPPTTDRGFRDRQRDATPPTRDWGRRGPDFTPTRSPNERRFSDWRDRPPPDRRGGEWNGGFRRRRLNEYQERHYWGEHRQRERGGAEAAD